jgi:hypothetical protein
MQKKIWQQFYLKSGRNSRVTSTFHQATAHSVNHAAARIEPPSKSSISRTCIVLVKLVCEL